MIFHPQISDIPALKDIWAKIFGDTPSYIDLFFADKFSPSSCLVYKEKEKIVSMIHFPQYKIKFYNSTLTAGYICGAATLPSHRSKGIMAKLIAAACDRMRDRGDAFAVLIPAGDRLFRFYENFGFATVFYLTRAEFSQKDITGESLPLYPTENPTEIMKIYKKIISSKDIALLQTADTYKAVMEENKSEGGKAYISKDALLFAFEKGGKLIVREILTAKPGINSLFLSLSRLYPAAKKIIVSAPPDAELKDSKPIPFGMAKILNKEKALCCFPGKPPAATDEIEFTKALFSKDAYMNMMLN